MGRPSNTDARRAEIVEAMMRVMARHGYAGASVSAIAREAGLAPGLVHYHFQNKQEILLSLVQRLAATARARFEARSKGARTEAARLDAFLDAHLARGADADPDAVACWVALGTEALKEPAVRQAYVAIVEEELAVLTELVREALREEGRRTARARRIAAGLFAAIEGAFRLAAVAPGTLPEGSAASLLRAMARGLLAAEPER